MYTLIRIIVIAVLYIIYIKKSKTIYKNRKEKIFSFLICNLLLSLTYYLPIENLFLTFKTSTKAYDYYSFGKTEIKYIIEGINSDLIVSSKKDVESHLIFPKSETGWKIGLPLDTKKIVQKFEENGDIKIYKYRKTNEHYIIVSYLTTEEIPKITDSNNSQFKMIETNLNQGDLKYLTYYTNIQNFNNDYWLKINEEKISVVD